MEIEPGDILEEARTAFSEYNYELSLEKYAWFFDNAIKIKKSYYGVRLSYCLIEWAELGEKYPKAKKALIKKKDESLRLFNESMLPAAFHEYESICDALNCQNEPVDVFHEVAKIDNELSKKLFVFVYEQIARNEEWSICREYLGNGYAQYKEVLELFDACIDGANRKGGEQGESIKSNSIQRTVEELIWIIKMQKYAKADDEVESALQRIEYDYGKRKYSVIYEKVVEKCT